MPDLSESRAAAEKLKFEGNVAYQKQKWGAAADVSSSPPIWHAIMTHASLPYVSRRPCYAWTYWTPMPNFLRHSAGGRSLDSVSQFVSTVYGFAALHRGNPHGARLVSATGQQSHLPEASREVGGCGVRCQESSGAGAPQHEGGVCGSGHMPVNG